MGCQCSKESAAIPAAPVAPVTVANNPPAQAPAMQEGGSKNTQEQTKVEVALNPVEVPQMKPEAAVSAVAPKELEKPSTIAPENVKPDNFDTASKISASKKKRMKKKAAKAAKAAAAGHVVDGSQGEEDASEDGSYLEEPTKKEFVEAVSSANQSYEAYYSADSEAPGDIRGRARKQAA